MTDYKKLVDALRCKRDDCEGCDISFFDKDEGWMCQYAAKDDDAAAAIEALIGTVGDLQAIRERLEEENDALRLEPKRGEWVVFNKQMLINLENAREQYKELGYPHRTELGLQCSNCRKVTYVDSGIKYEFCPHCGAKMEAQDG